MHAKRILQMQNRLVKGHKPVPVATPTVLHAGALGLQDQGPTGPVPLLAEEVVRGSAAAALSLLLTAVEPR
jgi:hypothetical protein